MQINDLLTRSNCEKKEARRVLEVHRTLCYQDGKHP